MAVEVWELDIQRDVAPISPNGHPHWSTTREEVAAWRMTAKLACKLAKVPKLRFVDLELAVRPPDARRRDEDNLIPYLLKPLKDGIVDAGVVPDDTAEYMSWRCRLLAPNGVKRWAYRLMLTDLSTEEMV